MCATLASASPRRMTIPNKSRIVLPEPPAETGRRTAPSFARRTRSTASNGRMRSRSRSLSPSAIRASRASSSAERRSSGRDGARLVADTGLFICLIRMTLLTLRRSELGKVIGHLDRLGQDLSYDEPVRGALQFGQEFLVVDGEIAVLPVHGDELVANLIAVFSGLLRDVLRVLAVLRDPLALGAEGIVHRADQRGIVRREFPGGQVGRIVDLEFEIAAFEEDVVSLVLQPRDIDARAPHRPRVHLSGRQGRRGIGRIEINELHLGAVDLVLLEGRHQQEFTKARTVDGNRLADEVLDLGNAGIILGDDRRGSWLVDDELGEDERRAGDDGGQRRRRAAAKRKVGAAAGDRLQGGGVVRKGSEPFDLDPVLRQHLLELAPLLGNEVEPAQPPGQADQIGGAAAGRARWCAEVETGERADAGRGSAEDAPPGRVGKRVVRHRAILSKRLYAAACETSTPSSASSALRSIGLASPALRCSKAIAPSRITRMRSASTMASSTSWVTSRTPGL